VGRIEYLHIDKDYFSELMNGTIGHGFEPVSEYALTLFGFPMHGYPLPHGIRYNVKEIISDVDGVWNNRSIFGMYIDALAFLNKEIKKLKGKIFSCIGELGPGNIDGPVGEIERYFIEARVSYIQHIWACLIAGRWTALRKNSIQCLSQLKRMYYDIEFFSGSPDIAVKSFVSNHMSMVGLGWRNARGSEYLADEDGFIFKIKPLLYEYKAEAVEERLKETVGTTKGINIVLSDEIGDIHMIQSFINPFILTGKSDDIPATVSICAPEAREDMSLIPPIIKRAEMGLCFALGYSKDEQKRILESATKFRKACKITEKSNADISVKEDVLNSLNEYKMLAKKLFTTSEWFTGLESLARKLEKAKTKEDVASCSLKLLKRFRKYSPHADISDSLLKYF
jgi:phosphoserine phosphatase